MSYAAFRRSVAAAAADVPAGTIVDIGTMPLPRALAFVFAAAATGGAVLLHDPARPAPEPAPLPAGCWLVAATSGSTAAPRAVCRTAASWAASVRPLSGIAGLTAADRVLLTGPLHATLHLHAAVHTLAVGAEVTDLPRRATAAHCVPAGLAALLDTLPADAPLRTVVVAGAALPESLAARAAERGWSVTEYYGAAELSFVAVRRAPDPMLRPFPGVDIRLDRDGVLWARSPYLALGYAGSHHGALRTDAAGYATVGDLAAATDGDPAHGIRIRGRGEAAVTTGGFTVLTEDVEAALRSIAGVRAAVAVGIGHPRLGQVLAAVVELDDGARLSAVRAAARAALSGPARPRRYVVVDALPRTPGGKVDRAAAATIALAHAAGP